MPRSKVAPTPDHEVRGFRAEKGDRGERGRAQDRVDHQHPAEPEPPKDGLGRELHGQRPDGCYEGELAGGERTEAESGLQHERQEERQGADADPEQEPAHDRGSECRHAQKVEVEHRMGHRRGMAHIEQDAEATDGQQHSARPAGDDAAADCLEAEHQPDQPDGGEQKPAAVEGGRSRLAHGRDEQRHQHEAEDRDRHVDPEDPAPVEVGRDEATEQRSDHRTYERRDGEPSHGTDHIGLADRAQQDEPAHRHHRGTAQTLQHACGNHLPQRAAEPAQDRAGQEDDDGAAEHVPGAKPVGHPAADRNEYGEAEQVAGDREAQPHRALAERRRDRRQRSGEHRRNRGSP